MRVFPILLIVMLFVAGTAEAAEPLSFVVPEYPPHSFADSSSPHGATGLSVDIVSAALDKMGVSYTLKVYPWARSLYLVEQGVVDGVINLYMTPERQQVLDYCSEPLFFERVYLFARAGTTIGWNGDFRSIAGKRLGVALGFSHGARADAAKVSGEINIIEFYSMQENINALMDGNVDVVLSDSDVARYLTKSVGKEGMLVALNPIVESVPSYVAFSKKRNLQQLRDRLDEVLRAMRENGDIALWERKYYGHQDKSDK